MTIPESFYGHDYKVVEVVTYRCGVCDRRLVKTASGFRHEPRVGFRGGDERDYDKQRDAAAKAARLAAATPYKGAIKDCQVSVYHSEGRWGTFRRCAKRARFVVSRSRYVDGPVAPNAEGKDRIAVCHIHAAETTTHRYVSHGQWNEGATAAELVEEEYR